MLLMNVELKASRRRLAKITGVLLVVADNPKRVKTEDPEEEFTVAEVIESGYRLRNGNDYEIIMPSKVSIYRYENRGGR